MKRALVPVAFGTSTSARKTYDYFEKKLRPVFPEEDIFWAFSSKMLRNKMSEHNITWQSPQQVLGMLAERGYSQAVLQSLHIVPGFEFEKLQRAAETAALEVAVVVNDVLNRRERGPPCIAADIGVGQ